MITDPDLDAATNFSATLRGQSFSQIIRTLASLHWLLLPSLFKTERTRVKEAA
jgi:hypothetical protein